MAALFFVAAACRSSLPALAAEAEASGFSHERWDKLLKANVTLEGWVSYESFKSRDASEFQAYLDALARASAVQLGSKDEQRAFWINAYNALCIRTLIDAGVPPEVPHAIVFGKNIFTQRKYTVAGKVRSLDEIEHEILRKTLPDPRIHAAVVCGAQSCPRLRPEAFVGSRLGEQLDQECRSWIEVEKTKDGVRKNFLDRGKNVYFVSKIFDWYAVDFGAGEKDLLQFLKKHAGDEVREHLEKNEVQVKYLPYDWSINKQ